MTWSTVRLPDKDRKEPVCSNEHFSRKLGKRLRLRHSEIGPCSDSFLRCGLVLRDFRIMREHTTCIQVTDREI
jgi:hypothetical protein